MLTGGKPGLEMINKPRRIVVPNKMTLINTIPATKFLQITNIFSSEGISYYNLHPQNNQQGRGEEKELHIVGQIPRPDHTLENTMISKHVI